MKRKPPPADLLAAVTDREHIPPRPPPELDPVLDAAERCLIRYGLRRASMTDIAKELGIARSTLYRQVSSIEEATALLAARQLYALLDEVIALLATGDGPGPFIDASMRVVTFARTSTLALRVLNEEPELIGGLLTNGYVPSYVDQVVGLVTPIFESAAATGSIRASDPRLTAALIIRLITILILVPAEDDLEAILRLALEPLLQAEHAHN